MAESSRWHSPIPAKIRRPFAESQTKCNHCKVPQSQKKLRKCTGCGITLYCSTECQKNDWKRHKTACRKLSDYADSAPQSFREEHYAGMNPLKLFASLRDWSRRNRLMLSFAARCAFRLRPETWASVAREFLSVDVELTTAAANGTETRSEKMFNIIDAQMLNKESVVDSMHMGRQLLMMEPIEQSDFDPDTQVLIVIIINCRGLVNRIMFSSSKQDLMEDEIRENWKSILLDTTRV